MPPRKTQARKTSRKASKPASAATDSAADVAPAAPFEGWTPLTSEQKALIKDGKTQEAAEAAARS